MTHGDLLNAILLEMSPFGLFWKNNTGVLKDKDGRPVRYGLPGSSDILGCANARFIGIEVKVGRDKQRQNQSDFATAVRNAGGIYILARSVEDVRNTLQLEGVI